MMKRFGTIGLFFLVLLLVAAQCSGGAVSDTTANTDSSQAEETTVEEAAPAEENTAEEVEESVAEEAEETTEEVAAESAAEEAAEDEPVAEAADETAAESNNEVAETEAETDEAAVADVSQQAANCDDPFADVENVRFTHEIWHAQRMARFAGPEIVDPESGVETNFCLHSVDYSNIISGGPPPDGIPPIDNPNFDTIAEGDDWLADVQPVISLSVGDEAKAYPLAILTRHEIANDEIDGVPVAVTFCPLCNSAVVFERTVDGEVLRFGVSGNLRNSDLIMWDNKTLSWWQQFTGEAIVGDMTGTQLEMIPAPVVAWKDFKEAFPEGQVLSNNGRNYGTNPYAGYDSTTQPFLFLGTPDSRLPATQRVLGYFNSESAVAYPLPVLAEEGVVEDTIEGVGDVVIFYEPGQVSALDKSVIEDSKEVGSAHMYIPEVDGQKLTFSFEDGVITDNETGSEWDVFGRAISGELEGAQLEPVLSHPHFWFAWAAFRPETRIYGQS